MDLSTPLGLIVFLGTPGFVSWIVSNVFDNWSWFVARTPMTKKAIVLGTSIILALASYVATQRVSPDFFTIIQPYYAVIYGAIVAFLAADQQHQNLKARQDRQAIRAAQIDVARGAHG